MIFFMTGMVDWRKVFSLISTRDQCQRSSPSRIPDTPWAGFEPAQDLSCAVVLTTTSQRHDYFSTQSPFPCFDKAFDDDSLEIKGCTIARSDYPSTLNFRQNLWQKLYQNFRITIKIISEILLILSAVQFCQLISRWVLSTQATFYLFIWFI